MRHVRKNGEEIIHTLKSKLAKVTHEYEEYKVKNNIDTYFAENISKESGAKVIKEITEFIQRKDSEAGKKPFDPATLDLLTFSNSTRSLAEISEDLEHYIKMKIQYFRDDAERDEAI